MKKPAMSTGGCLELTSFAEVDNIRDISSDIEWLYSAVYAWRLKPGQGALYINRKHDKLRIVAMLDEPVLICFGVHRINPRDTFTVTVKALLKSQLFELSTKVRRALVTQDWSQVHKLGTTPGYKRKAAR